MEGFKPNIKMACYKAGGAVQNVMKKGGKTKRPVPKISAKDAGPVAPVASPLPGTVPVEDTMEAPVAAPTMKRGGRAKKSTGTVKKYCGGGKMDKYAEGSVVVSAPYDTKYQDKKTGTWIPTKKKGGVIKKADGGIIDTIKDAATDLKEKVLGTPEQNKAAQESMDKQAAKGSKLAKFFGGKADAPSAPAKKRGGKC